MQPKLIITCLCKSSTKKIVFETHQTWMWYVYYVDSPYSKAARQNLEWKA